MRLIVVSQKKLYRLPSAVEYKMFRLYDSYDEIYTDYSTYHLFHGSTVRNTLWFQEHMSEFDMLVVLCYSGHTELIKTAENLGLEVILFEEQ
jgi:hypothetical protein